MPGGLLPRRAGCAGGSGLRAGGVNGRPEGRLPRGGLPRPTREPPGGQALDYLEPDLRALKVRGRKGLRQRSGGGFSERRYKIAPRRSLRLVRGASLGRKPVPNLSEKVRTQPF